MDKQLRVNEFKKEYLEEIESVDVKMEDLKKNKVPEDVLEAEVVLRKVFGDEIYVPKKKEEVITGEKEIVKLSEEDVAFDGQVRDIVEGIVDEEFDNKVALLLSKVNFEDDE